jgi:serine/threonine protein kinase
MQMYGKVPAEIKGQLKDEIDANISSSIKAPEQLDLNLGFSLNEKVDIYAIGCLIYQLIFNRRYDASQPIFTARYGMYFKFSVDWHQYSDKLTYLIK